MKLHVTENKSKGTLRPTGNAVRVFVDNDYHYGYFVSEDKLVALLDQEQQKVYVQGDEAILDVTPEVAQQIIDAGHTPYKKAQVA